jgi:hypothetical protein
MYKDSIEIHAKAILYLLKHGRPLSPEAADSLRSALASLPVAALP